MGKPTERQIAAQEKREAKAREKAAKAQAVATAPARCRELAKAIPAEFSQWGVIRTRYWEQTRERCAELVAFRRPHLNKMLAAIGAMEQVNTLPV